MNESEQRLLGYIKGKVEDIDKKLGDVCDTVGDNVKAVTAAEVRINGIEKIVGKQQEKIAKHDAVFGKIGAGIAALMFVISVGINLVIDWIRSKLG